MKIIVTALLIGACISMPTEAKNFYLEVPGSGYIYLVEAKDELEAMFVIGATVWPEKEFRETAKRLDVYMKDLKPQEKPQIYDRRNPKPGPVRTIPWDEFIESLNK